ncbi:hypothetical protein Tco_0127873 [Tanacetum coccineum]
MGDENSIRTLGDYSKFSHEGYNNTIELPTGNNVVPLQSDIIRRNIDQSAGGKLCEINAKESWALLEDCDNYDLSNQSIECDHLNEIGMVVRLVKFISYTFGDKEMILWFKRFSDLSDVYDSSNEKVVRDYIGRFVDVHHGLRQVEFALDLVHGATSVAKSPYRLAPFGNARIKGRVKLVEKSQCSGLSSQMLWTRYWLLTVETSKGRERAKQKLLRDKPWTNKWKRKGSCCSDESVAQNTLARKVFKVGKSFKFHMPKSGTYGVLLGPVVNEDNFAARWFSSDC